MLYATSHKGCKEVHLFKKVIVNTESRVISFAFSLVYGNFLKIHQN